MNRKPDIREKIIDTFGTQSYLGDGSLNRIYLADQAFSEGRVEELNAIVHPHIPEETEKIMAEAEKEGYELFVYEAALLLQNLRPGHLDYIVLVLADRKKRIERVTERDGVDRKEVVERMENQQNFNRLTHLADIVIENNGSREELENRAREVYSLMLGNR